MVKQAPQKMAEREAATSIPRNAVMPESSRITERLVRNRSKFDFELADEARDTKRIRGAPHSCDWIQKAKASPQCL